MPILPQQPSSANEILFASFKLYRDSFVNLIGYSLIVFAINMLLNYFMNDFIFPDSTLSPDEQLASILQILPSLLGMIFVNILGSCIFYGAMISRIDNVAKGRADNFVEPLLWAVKKFPAITVAVLLYMLAIIIGSVLLVVPAVILMISLSFCGYFILLEDKNGYESLIASHRLVWGDWWRTNWVFFVPSLLILAFFVSIGFMFNLVADMDASSNMLNMILELLTVFTTPYVYVIGYLQFHDLKLRKKM